MRIAIYSLVVVVLGTTARGFAFYSEEELARRAQRISSARAFVDWSLIRPSVLAESRNLPESSEIEQLTPPGEWKYSYLDDTSVRFHAAPWALHLYDMGSERTCTVYVPLISRDDGHGFIAFVFAIETVTHELTNGDTSVVTETMKSLVFQSYRYLSDDADDFIMLQD